LAGGVSDGGGGITNPKPSGPEHVISAIREYGAPAIITFLNSEEANYWRQSEADRERSVYRKLFSNSNPSIYDVVRSVAVEYRLSEPCFDKNGLSKDGSIYAAKPGHICISPFVMAPKLNQNNCAYESIALLLHEIVHLVGADEGEAQQIQQEAIWALKDVDLLDLSVNIDLMVGQNIAPIQSYLKFIGDYPKASRKVELESLSQSLLNLRDDKLSHSSPLGLQLVRPQVLESLDPQFERIVAMRLYFDSIDMNENEEYRKFYEAQISKIYHSDEVLSARVFSERYFGSLQAGGPIWDEVMIPRPTSAAAIREIAQGLSQALRLVQQEIALLKEFDFPGYRKP
jgi:hypothetical protein